jgi:UDP:flavonoid glycosyltransferase YjiC (YdhE family)
VRQFVPHGAVLDRACCAITHGGMGTTVKALDRGVPVCVVPFARDQAEVARRVEMAGAAPNRSDSDDDDRRRPPRGSGFRRDRRRCARS